MFVAHSQGSFEYEDPLQCGACISYKQVRSPPETQYNQNQEINMDTTFQNSDCIQALPLVQIMSFTARGSSHGCRAMDPCGGKMVPFSGKDI